MSKDKCRHNFIGYAGQNYQCELCGEKPAANPLQQVRDALRRCQRNLEAEGHSAFKYIDDALAILDTLQAQPGEDVAAIAYNNAAMEYFGESAFLNTISNDGVVGGLDASTRKDEEVADINLGEQTTSPTPQPAPVCQEYTTLRKDHLFVKHRGWLTLFAETGNGDKPRPLQDDELEALHNAKFPIEAAIREMETLIGQEDYGMVGMRNDGIRDCIAILRKHAGGGE